MSYYDHIQSNEGMVGQLWSKARQRPEALLLFAAGFALIMSKKSARAAMGSAQQSVTSRARDAQGYVSDVASDAIERASSLAEPVRDYANRVTSYVSETSGSALSQASDLAQQTREMAASNLDHYMREQPLALGLLSLAFGAAIGAALPETDVENRTLGSQRDLLARKAREAAGEQIEQLKAAAGQFGEQVTQTLKDQGGDSGSNKSAGGANKSTDTSSNKSADNKTTAGAGSSSQGGNNNSNA